MSLRLGAFLWALLAALVSSGAAHAHASLVRSSPADGAVLSEPPATLRLTFNEPVTPLVMRLIAPDGTATTPPASSEGATIVVAPHALRRGTHVLSWRAISADGHPVGGSLVFSIGEASARPAAEPAGDRVVNAVLWASKVVVYLALFVGVGGAFFRAWISDGSPRWLSNTLIGLIFAGLLVTPLSVGLLGLDALNLPLQMLAQARVWGVGIATSYGLTAITIVIALFAGLFALEVASKKDGSAVARALSLAALLVAGLAPALSGHASSATPQLLMRPAVFVHVVGVAFWIGALLPLLASVMAREFGPLLRFSRAIPYVVVALVASGGVLVLMQLDRPDALWTTQYGIVLSWKLVLVCMLLVLAAANRFVFTAGHHQGDAVASRALTRLMATEILVAVAIFALAASWRFTPPPRALAVAAAVEVHLHEARAMAHLSLLPVRGRDPQVAIEVFDAALNPLAVKEVTVALTNPAAGIEPIRRDALRVLQTRWRVDGLRVPVAGKWTVRVEVLIDDFEKIVLEDQVDLPRLP
jgi:copper transport protein